MEFARWQASHLAWKIGATSFVNVGVSSAAAYAVPGASAANAATAAGTPRILVSIGSSFRSRS